MKTHQSFHSNSLGVWQQCHHEVFTAEVKAKQLTWRERIQTRPKVKTYHTVFSLPPPMSCINTGWARVRVRFQKQEQGWKPWVTAPHHMSWLDACAHVFNLCEEPSRHQMRPAQGRVVWTLEHTAEYLEWDGDPGMVLALVVYSLLFVFYFILYIWLNLGVGNSFVTLHFSCQLKVFLSPYCIYSSCCECGWVKYRKWFTLKCSMENCAFKFLFECFQLVFKKKFCGHYCYFYTFIL